MSERVVLCEGFRDRAFWAAWLPRLGWTDMARGRRPRPRFEELEVEYRVGAASAGEMLSLQRGDFAFRRGEERLRVHPCGSDDGVLKAVEPLLEVRVPRTLVACLDSDAMADDPDPTARRRAQVDEVLRKVRQQRPGETVREVPVVVWHTPTAAGTRGVPQKQTLERLVVDCVVAARPDRADGVASFLDGAGFDASQDAKAHAWSHMARWYPDRGCDDFYRAVWKDAAIAEKLESRLKAIGAWEVAAAL